MTTFPSEKAFSSTQPLKLETTSAGCGLLFEGIPASSGIVIGKAHIHQSICPTPEAVAIPSDRIEEEVERFRHALLMARGEVRGLRHRVAEMIDEKQAAIFDAHEQMLFDTLIIDSTIEGIRSERKNAECVFHSVLQDIVLRMSGIDGPSINERHHDLLDVGHRVINNLMYLNGNDMGYVPDGAVIIAHDLTPSATAHVLRHRINGIALDRGSSTSHTAIMAKAVDLPTVVGLECASGKVRHGDPVIVDGNSGRLIVRPSAAQLQEYQQRREAWLEEKEALRGLRSLPARTTDGIQVELAANIELPSEIKTAAAQGAEGIGLFRTEFLYLNTDEMPEEEEQIRVYRAAIDTFGGENVVFRTLDIGGDKLPSGAECNQMNPLMGPRALRLCMRRLDMFGSQLRAMLRAAAGSTLQIMFPMVTGLSEFRQAKDFLLRELSELEEQGADLPTDLKIGIMIETPSAAWICDLFVGEADFFSLGTNDLIQYTLVVDRSDRRIAHYYDPLHPAILRSLAHVAEVSRVSGLPLSVCGEMAGDPRLALVLLGLGLNRLSMNPASIPYVKRMIRNYRAEDLRHLACELLEIRTAEKVAERLDQFINFQKREETEEKEA